MSERLPPAAEPEDHLGMTDEQWAWFQTCTHGYGEQDENGVDVSLIRYMLSLSPLERLRVMERHAQDTLLLLEYGRRARDAAAAGRH